MWAGSGAVTGIWVSFIFLELLDPPESLSHCDNPHRRWREEAGRVSRVPSPWWKWNLWISTTMDALGLSMIRSGGKLRCKIKKSSPLSSLPPPQKGKIPSERRTSEDFGILVCRRWGMRGWDTIWAKPSSERRKNPSQGCLGRAVVANRNSFSFQNSLKSLIPAGLPPAWLPVQTWPRSSWGTPGWRIIK